MEREVAEELRIMCGRMSTVLASRRTSGNVRRCPNEQTRIWQVAS